MNRKLEQHWSGIGFRVGQQYLAIAINEMQEVYNYNKFPKPSPLPTSSPWILGVASRHGHLVSILDLGGFLSSEPTRITPDSRVLVVKYPQISAGLLVDEVAGIRHFKDREQLKRPPHGDDKLMNLLITAYKQDKREWGVLSIAKLARLPDMSELAG